jgi:hypothetical protein
MTKFVAAWQWLLFVLLLGIAATGRSVGCEPLEGGKYSAHGEEDTASLLQGYTHKHVAHNTSFAQVFVVFPGLGQESRVPVVRQSIQILKAELGDNFECMLRIWAEGAREDPRFEASLFAPCQVDYHPHSQVFSSLKMVNAPRNLVHGSSVFMLLDDIALQPRTLNMLRMVMVQKDLDVVSASYHKAWCSKMKPRSGEIAHLSSFVEFNAVLFKPSAFACLQSMINPTLNSLGWGYDNMYSGLCDVRMAVCDACEVNHTSFYTHKYAGKPDTYDHQEASHMMGAWKATLGSKAELWDNCDGNKPSPALSFSPPQRALLYGKVPTADSDTSVLAQN